MLDLPAPPGWLLPIAFGGFLVASANWAEARLYDMPDTVMHDRTIAAQCQPGIPGEPFGPADVLQQCLRRAGLL